MNAASATECASAPWLSNAALGKPVVPEVNSTMPPSSGPISSGRNSRTLLAAVNSKKFASMLARSGDAPTMIRGHAGSGNAAVMISARSASMIASLHCAVSIARNISSATPRLLTKAATPPTAVIANTLMIHSIRLLITTATFVPFRTLKRLRNESARAAACAKPSLYVRRRPSCTTITRSPKCMAWRYSPARLRGAPAKTC